MDLLIRRVIWANLFYSLIIVGFLLGMTEWVDTLLGLGAPAALAGVGWVLAPWLAVLYWTATRPVVPVVIVRLLAWADVGWAVMAGVMLLAGWPALSVQGAWIFGLSSVPVAVMGALEARALRVGW